MSKENEDQTLYCSSMNINSVSMHEHRASHTGVAEKVDLLGEQLRFNPFNHFLYFDLFLHFSVAKLELEV